MGVNAGSLQVVDIEVILEIDLYIVLLYGTYLPAALVVFVLHLICDSMLLLLLLSSH